MSEKHGSRKHYSFTFFGASNDDVPNIILQYTAAPKAPGQKVNFVSGKTKSSNKKGPQSALARVLNELLKKVSQKDKQDLFARPVTDDIAPNYSLVIKEPIDLSIIKAKVHDDEYETLQQFREDMYLMFRNCMTYNPPGSYVYNEGEALLSFFRKCFKQAKNQLKGEGQPPTESTVTSFARGEAGPERASRGVQDITGVDIPVVFDEPVVRSEMPTFKPSGQSIMFGYIPHPPNAQAHDEAKFEAACEIIARSAKLRRSLKILDDRFPQYVLADAVRELAGVSRTYACNMGLIRVAMESTDDSANCIGIGMAPIDSDSLRMLASSCPALPLDCMRRTDDDADTLKDQNLRLMTFYNNCLRHWRKGNFNAGKRKIMDAVTHNITKIVMDMKPSVVIKDRTESLVIQHVACSTQAI